MRVLRKNNQGKITRQVSIAFIVFTLISPVLSMEDMSAPLVLDFEPFKGELGVSPLQTICAHLQDPPLENGDPGSGIDLSSVRLTIDTEAIPIFIDNLGQNRIYMHSNNPSAMPETSWINARIYAKDLHGNIMSAFTWTFFTGSLPDENPPLIANLSPADESRFVNPAASVYCKIYDYESGVDPEAVEMQIEGEVIPIELLKIESGYMALYNHDNPFEFDSIIHVEVVAADFEENISRTSWSFRTVPPPNHAPSLMNPENHELLNYQLTDGIVRFRWTYSIGDVFYRIRIRIADTPSYEVIDMGPADYIVINETSVEYRYPIDKRLWAQIAELGDISWRICKVDGYNGRPISPDSSQFFFHLALPDIVVLRNPSDDAIIYANEDSPTFRWDPFDNAIRYTIGIARVGVDGEFIGDFYIYHVNAPITAYSLSSLVWRSFQNGIYLWTVIADLPENEQSDFVNYYFEKKRRLLMQPIINF